MEQFTQSVSWEEPIQGNSKAQLYSIFLLDLIMNHEFNDKFMKNFRISNGSPLNLKHNILLNLSFYSLLLTIRHKACSKLSS